MTETARNVLLQGRVWPPVQIMDELCRCLDRHQLEKNHVGLASVAGLTVCQLMLVVVEHFVKL